MKALILAAGQGTRIRSTHGEHPKCLITFNNSEWTILDQQIRPCRCAGYREIGIVVGYEKEQIIRHVTKTIGARSSGLRFIENQRLRRNQQHLLALARARLAEGQFLRGFERRCRIRF